MLRDMSIYRESFEIRTYHQFVAWSLSHGFKWTRYTRKGDYLTITNLKICGGSIASCEKGIADRYERWFKWMKNNPGRN